MMVKDLLEPELITVQPTDNLSEAWQIMKDAGITGAVVVTEDGKIVGFITDGDLIRSAMPSGTDLAIYDEIMEKMEIPTALVRNLRSWPVEHAMQSAEKVVTIDSEEPVLKALALMFQHHLRRIPVLDGNQLIGTISRGTILTHLLLERDLKKSD